MIRGSKACIWQTQDCPAWRFDLAALAGPLAEVRHAQGQLLGRLSQFGMGLRAQHGLQGERAAHLKPAL